MRFRAGGADAGILFRTRARGAYQIQLDDDEPGDMIYINYEPGDMIYINYDRDESIRAA